VTIFEHGYHSR